MSCGGLEVQPALTHWLMPVILATWEAEIRRITFLSQPAKIVHKTPSPK
jgi:hypothetical protein